MKTLILLTLAFNFSALPFLYSQDTRFQVIKLKKISESSDSVQLHLFGTIDPKNIEYKDIDSLLLKIECTNEIIYKSFKVNKTPRFSFQFYVSTNLFPLIDYYKLAFRFDNNEITEFLP